MDELKERAPTTSIKASLVALTGPTAGNKHPLDQPMVTIGRDQESHVVPVGERAATASQRHLKITREGHSFVVHDLQSTNGTFVDDHRIETAILEPGMVISLGQNGSRFRFVIEEDAPSPSTPAGKTLITPLKLKTKNISDKDERALNDAVRKARAVRDGGGGDTVIIMREVLQDAIRRGKRKHKITSFALLLALLSVCFYSAGRINRLEEKKMALDERILLVEEHLTTVEDPEQLSKLIKELETYQERAHDIQRNLLYQIGHRDAEEDFIIEEISRVMSDFGASEYSIPPTFVERVQANILRFQHKNRGGITKALGSSRDDLEAIRSKLEEKMLPPDLAYMVLVESAFDFEARSRAGAAGPWQFVPGTARAYGLKVTRQQDDRYDVTKATDAAGRYIRHLILEFGSGDGVMLALAAYNLGPTKVKRAIRKVEDPIRQRDFWYLYRMRALPNETREYVPKVIAAIIIGRNPERFGFTS